MIETKVQYTHILTIDREALALMAKDSWFALAVYVELAGYRSTDRTERADGLYCRSDVLA